VRSIKNQDRHAPEKQGKQHQHCTGAPSTPLRLQRQGRLGACQRARSAPCVWHSALASSPQRSTHTFCVVAMKLLWAARPQSPLPVCWKGDACTPDWPCATYSDRTVAAKQWYAGPTGCARCDLAQRLAGSCHGSLPKRIPAGTLMQPDTAASAPHKP